MAETLTTLFEVVCAVAVAVAVGVIAGWPWALLTAGILGLVGSWAVNR